MKRTVQRTKSSAPGFAGLPMVTFFGVLMILGLAMVYRGTIIKRDQAAKIQLRLDYHQREEALMRALVAVFPQKVVACMKGNYVAADSYSWSSVFADAIARSSADQALAANLDSTLGITGARRADVGDDTAEEVQSWITSLGVNGEPGKVTPGTSSYAQVFADAGVAAKIPPLLKASGALETLDETHPVVSPEKVYASQDAGLLANIGDYPKFNLISYPNIRFGYASPGDPFVAKRHWWAFTVRYGKGVGMTKNYVLSLYEVPSQLPIEAATFAEIGQHQDGTTWGAGITIDGGVYADSLKMNGAHGASRLAGRESIELTQALTLDGTTVDSDFDALGVRELMQAEARTNLLPIALSANSGRVVFYPVPSGLPFLNVPTGTTTKWDVYKSGGIDCKVQVEAIAMVSLADQTPTSIRVKFATVAGTNQTVVLTRGSNWPTAAEPGGDVIPFQTELTNSNRSCLTFSPSLLNAWLQTNGGADVTVNNGVHFSVNTSVDPLTVKAVASPPDDVDMCVIIRKGKDLTSFTKGLSIVGPLRVYIGDDLNDVAMAAAPTGSGLPSGATFYPPMSIFAAELRVGTTAFNRPFDHHGQMGSLQTGGTVAWRPMDVKSGSDEAVHSDEIEADLTPLLSPAELPPIHQMNWLVVVEEIPQ